MGYTIHRSTIFHESTNNILIRLAGFPPHIFCQTCFELIIIEKEREEKEGEKEKKETYDGEIIQVFFILHSL